MEISHKTTFQDKMKSILLERNWKQKDLARKLEVSEKTISFLLNGKRRPKEILERKIDELYDETGVNPETSNDVINDVQKYQAKREINDLDKILTGPEKEYYDAKCYVLSKEETNNQYIYLFSSLGNEDDGWYKIGGNSLLFYKTLLAPRLGRIATLREDNDKIHQFRSGVVSVRWGNKLMVEAESLGYKTSKIQYGIIVIDLMKEYSESEIKGLKETVKAERAKLRKMITPKNNYPNLMMAMNKLVAVLPSKVKKLDKAYREVLGRELLEPMAELLKIYFRFANGEMERKDAKLEMLERVDDLSAMLYLMDESKMLEITARTRLGENVVNIRNAITENL